VLTFSNLDPPALFQSFRTISAPVSVIATGVIAAVRRVPNPALRRLPAIGARLTPRRPGLRGWAGWQVQAADVKVIERTE
jgi:hypothetical protein